MKVKQLACGRFEVVAVIEGDECPAEQFLRHGEATTKAARYGLTLMLRQVAAEGLQNVPSAWFHEADKERQIYEFIKGALRLFFFRGKNGQVAVCVAGVRKTGQKANKFAVDKAAKCRDDYYKALESNALIKVIDNET